MSVQNAAGWGYFNTEKREWNTEILQEAGFPTRFLPKIELGGNYAGRCSSTAWLVIPEGTPVGAAMGDFQCSVFSTLTLPDQAILNISTSAQLAFVMPEGFRPQNDSHSDQGDTGESHVQYYPYFGGRYLAVADAMTGGNCLAAFVSMLQQWAVTLGCNVPQCMSICTRKSNNFSELIISLCIPFIHYFSFQQKYGRKYLLLREMLRAHRHRLKSFLLFMENVMLQNKMLQF